MITPKFIELSYIRQIYYDGDEEDRKCYHLLVATLLDFNGEEVVTNFFVNIQQLDKMGLEAEIPSDLRIQVYRQLGEREVPEGWTTIGDIRKLGVQS